MSKPCGMTYVPFFNVFRRRVCTPMSLFIWQTLLLTVGTVQTMSYRVRLSQGQALLHPMEGVTGSPTSGTFMSGVHAAACEQPDHPSNSTGSDADVGTIVQQIAPRVFAVLEILEYVVGNAIDSINRLVSNIGDHVIAPVQCDLPTQMDQVVWTSLKNRFSSDSTTTASGVNRPSSTIQELFSAVTNENARSAQCAWRPVQSFAPEGWRSG